MNITLNLFSYAKHNLVMHPIDVVMAKDNGRIDFSILVNIVGSMEEFSKDDTISFYLIALNEKKEDTKKLKLTSTSIPKSAKKLSIKHPMDNFERTQFYYNFTDAPILDGEYYALAAGINVGDKETIDTRTFIYFKVQRMDNTQIIDEMRNFTEEEEQLRIKGMESRSTPIGINAFDLTPNPSDPSIKI